MTDLEKRYKTLLHEINRERNIRTDELRLKQDVRSAAELLWLEIEFKFTKHEKDKP